MKYAVIYASKSGRTKMIADAIAEVLEVTANSTDYVLSEDVETLFIGSGVYGGISRGIEKFLKNNNVKINEVVTFSTLALKSSAHEDIKKVVEKYSYEVSSKSFSCPGVLPLKYRDRPNQDDLANAKEFAKSFVGKE